MLFVVSRRFSESQMLDRMQTSEAQRFFMTLTQKVARNWSRFSGSCKVLYEYFEKPSTESFLVDITAQALPETYCFSPTRLWPVIERWSIQLSDITHAHDSHYLDDATICTVLEKLQELVYSLLCGDVKCARDMVYQGPQMLVTSQLHLKVIQSHRPNIPQLRSLLELSLLRYKEAVNLSQLPRTEFHPFTKTSCETILDCFRRSIARIQDPTITFEDRLHIHTFVLIVSRLSWEHSRVLLANRSLYWLCTSLSCLPPMLAANPGKYGEKVPGLCLAYLTDQLDRSGPEYMSEALDADILDTMLKLVRLSLPPGDRWI
ncbi:hypothetical protein F5146DRAFT_1137003 [Armillaria mellea]|nr:hypothetical protein F5146DRAFT_1137003 [Armillaria mellea]